MLQRTLITAKSEYLAGILTRMLGFVAALLLSIAVAGVLDANAQSSLPI